MILYKRDRLAYEFAYDVDWRVRMIVFELEHQCAIKGCGVRVTSIIRSSGIHTKRALDCTFFDLTDYAKNDNIGEVMEAHLNGAFEYGLGHDGKVHPTALWHDVGTGPHLHVQVPDHDLIVRR